MDFTEFSRICEEIEAISGRLEMIDVIASVLPGLSDDELPAHHEPPVRGRRLCRREEEG